MTTGLSRRDWLASLPLAAASAPVVGRATAGPTRQPAPAEFGYCLNTSTIRGQKLSIAEEVKLISAAGYQGIEPWISELQEYQSQGGSLEDLGKRIKDGGLVVADAIGFAEWAVDDDDRRRKGLETLKRDMALVKKIGGSYIAAPPADMTDRADVDYLKFAERYRAILDIGANEGVTPMVEVWGFSKCLNRLGQAALVAIESGHPSACILPDVYHMYKGGGGAAGIRLLNGEAIRVIHMNDYPADPPRETITDAQRVYPGDGVAPIRAILADLRAIGSNTMLSLELFNKDYWAQDAAAVLKTGLERMKAAVAASR